MRRAIGYLGAVVPAWLGGACAGTIKAPVSVQSLPDPSVVTDLQKNGSIDRVSGA